MWLRPLLYTANDGWGMFDCNVRGGRDSLPIVPSTSYRISPACTWPVLAAGPKHPVRWASGGNVRPFSMREET
eukprot:751082-Hanusia_phi.AAC.5